MNEALKIQERLKDIATEMAALAELETATADQEAQYEALEAEADSLTAELETLRAEERAKERKQKAEEIRNYARAGTRVTAPNSTTPRIGRVRESVADDPKRGFKSFADFATRLKDAGEAVRSDDKLMMVAAGTGMNQSVNQDGAVLVPPAFSRTIWDGVIRRSNSLLQYCDQIPIDSNVESVTIPAVNETSRADGSRGGGIRGYWKGELTEMTSSRPQFREIKLAPHELYVFAYISDKLLRNAPQTASRVLETGAADEIAFKVGDAIFEGDGVGKPFGIKTHTSTVSVAKETGQAAASIVPANIRKMMARLHPNYMDGAVWFINQDVLPVLESMEFPVGVGGVPAYLPPGGMADATYSRLYGKPVIPIEYCETVGTVGDIVLANMRAYAAGIKGLVDTSYSMHLKFDFAQTAYRVIFEMDGQPWLNSAITPFKGTNTTSAFVTLATRS